MIKAPLELNESAVGYLFRLSTINGYRSPPFEGGMRHKTLSRLAQAFGLPDTVIEDLIGNAATRRAPFHGHEIDTWHINFRQPKLCSLCIQEKLLLLRNWDLTLYTACPLHKCNLTNTCPTCLSPLTWDRDDASACGKCKNALTSHSLPPAPDSCLRFCTLVDSALSTGYAQLPLRDGQTISLSFAALLRAVYLLGATATHTKSCRRAPTDWERKKGDAVKIVERAMAILEALPDSLDAFFRETDKSRSPIQHSYLPSESLVRRSIPAELRPLFRHGFSKYRALEDTSRPRERCLRQSANPATYLVVGTPVLSRPKARALTGLNSRQLDELANRNFVDRVLCGRRIHYSANSIDYICKKIRSFAEPPPERFGRQSPGYMPLSSLPATSFIQVIQAILNGEVPTYTRRTELAIGRHTVRSEDIDATKERAATFISIESAAKLLKCSPTTIFALIRAGLLALQPKDPRIRPFRALPLTSLDAFSTHCLLTSDLSRRLGVSTRSVAKVARQLALFPSQVLNYSQRKLYVWDRFEFEQALGARCSAESNL